MTEKAQKRAIVDKMPRISQKLRLTCRQCGEQAPYDVGAILCDQEGEGESAKRHYAFTNYFRCRQCGSAGPWDIADYIKMVGLALRAKVDRGFEGLMKGRCALFDGTFIQAPAMGEEHLLDLLQKDPANGFLCSRLGNLLRNCGQTAKAAEWYAKALGLDPGDIEARHELFYAAVDSGDIRTALTQAFPLVRCLLEGRKTDNEDLNEDIALSLASSLRSSAEQFQACLPAGPGETLDRKAEVFIRTLLSQEGDEEEIVEEAAERLLTGKPAPGNAGGAPQAADDSLSPATNLAPTLRALVEAEGLEPERLSVALEASDQGNIRVQDKHSVLVSDGKKMARWQVPALGELFRGSRTPPPDMDHYPEEYALHFYFIENHVLTVCAAKGDRTDQEMEEIYSTLRRRPDGRSLGAVHDFLWQVVALLLGTRVLSQAEFEALLGALVRSTRKWGLRPVSRYYVAYLHRTFEGAKG